MYRITNINSGADLGLVDKVFYIKFGERRVFTPASEEDAIGVAFDSVAYNLAGHDEIKDADTVVVSKIDGGHEVRSHQAAIEGLIRTVLEG